MDKYGSIHVESWYHSTRRTLMCILCNKMSRLLRSDTYCGFYWYSDLISHTQTHTAHSRASKLTNPYNYMFTLTCMCSQQLPLLH